jgi:HEPN domain-containing protein
MNAKNNAIFEWKRLAEQDLTTAHRIFELHRPMPFEIICSLSQQSAEKMLKCFLVHNGIVPPKTHNMQTLIDMCVEIDDSFNTLETEADKLTDYGVMPRYPAELDLDEPDAALALKYADKIVAYVNGIVFSPTEETTT